MSYDTPNPVRQMIRDAEGLLTRLDSIASEFEDEIEVHELLNGQLRESKRFYEEMEAAVIYEAEIMGKDGPFNGIAKSSPAYRSAITSHVAASRQADPVLADAYDRVLDYERKERAASINRLQAETRFRATRSAAELRASMLRASL